MTTAEISTAGYNRLCQAFAAENAIATLSASSLPAEPGRPMSNSQILKILLNKGDGITTFASGSPFAGFKISNKILRLE
jgi:hypothetical protein